MADAINDDALDDDDFVETDDSGTTTDIEMISDEAFNIAVKNRVRDELAKQVEAFLAQGGKINNVDANVSSDPPKKPSSNYGSRPI